MKKQLTLWLAVLSLYIKSSEIPPPLNLCYNEGMRCKKCPFPLMDVNVTLLSKEISQL